MALIRVRSKSKPQFESIVSQDWVDRFPDDWDVLDGDLADAKTPAVARAQAAETNQAGTAAYSDDTNYR